MSLPKTPPPGSTGTDVAGWIDPAGEVPALTDQAALIVPYEAIVDVDDPHPL